MRSPQLSAISRAARQHAAERNPQAFSRRALLGGAGALAGAAVLSGPVGAGARLPQPRIAIIGGGISGLSAALELSDAGLASTVYEAQGRVGGRMHSNASSWLDAQTSEWGGEFIDTGHKLMLSLCRRFGLNVVDVLQAQPSGSQDTRFLLGGYYSDAQFSSDFGPVYKVLKDQVQAIGSGFSYDSLTAAGRSIDAMSLASWIDRYVPGGRSSQLGALLDTAYDQEFGLDTELQSAFNLVTILGYQVKPGNPQIYGKSDQRYSIVGGNEQLPRAIASALPDGTVQTGRRLRRIAANPDGSYLLTFDGTGRDRNVVADRVIMTLPFSVLRGIDTSAAGFDQRKLTAIGQLGYGTNSKLSLQFDQRAWEQPGPWGLGNGSIYTDLPFQNTWDSSRGRQGSSGVLTVFTGGTSGASYVGAPGPYSDDSSAVVRSYAQQFLGQLDQVMPGVSSHWNGRATLSTPWSDPNQLGSYACYRVGQIGAFGGYEKVRQGRCHFAGEHCSFDFQGYMEGAAREGVRAADEILADLRAGQLA